MIVADDAASRRTSSELLGDDGYAVACASNVREALACLRDDPSSVALVLVDLTMPGVDGLQFHAERERDPTLAATFTVVMTAHGATEHASIDADAILSEAFDVLKRMDTIERSCRRA